MAVDIFKGVLPFNDFKKATCEETYLEVENLLRSIVWKLVRKYGGDFEEMMQEAACIYIAAYENFDGRIPFSSWLYNWVRWTLMDQLRLRLSRGQRYEPTNEQDIPGTYRDWTATKFMEEMGEDAAMVAKLVLETPAELAKIVSGKGSEPRNYRSSIRTYLSDLGWTARRVAASFSEIRHALVE